jgi:hypothetical protein
MAAGRDFDEAGAGVQPECAWAVLAHRRRNVAAPALCTPGPGGAEQRAHRELVPQPVLGLPTVFETPMQSRQNRRSEVAQAESMMRREGIAWLSSTHKAIEEITTTILHDLRPRHLMY